jgi:hypothetical protein
MDPELVFFIVRGVLRVGTAARDAYEQSVRDASFQMPDLPFMQESTEQTLQRFFNLQNGALADLVDPAKKGPLANCWLPGDIGGHPKTDSASLARLLDAKAAFEHQLAIDAGSDPTRAGLRAVDQSSMVGILDQWSDKAKPVGPWGHIAVALAGVALDYVGSNPGILGVGSSGEALISALCSNITACLDEGVVDGPQAYFVERMGVSILQAGLKTITDNPDLVTTDKAVGSLIGAVASPLAALFQQAIDTNSYADQLRWINIRDNVLPKMVSAGLSALADHQEELLGAPFDPNDTLGYFTKGFLGALSQTSVLKLGDPEAWVPIYHAMLQAVVARPNLLIKVGNGDANAQAIQDLVGNLAATLDKAPLPYSGDTAIDLGLVVIDELQKTLPTRTSDPWINLVPSALRAVVQGLSAAPSTANLPAAELSAVVRVVLNQIAATPGMIVGNSATSSSIELQAIISAVATAMAQDKTLLVSSDGWAAIAATAAQVAARNPGKLFSISDATPEGQLAGVLISQLLTKAAQGFANGRASGVVLFGDTLVGAIQDTLTAAAGNAKGALVNTGQMLALVDQLNGLVAEGLPVAGKPPPANPISAADWSWLYRNLIAGVFDKGTLAYTDDQLRGMLFNHTLPDAPRKAPSP